ncbi:rhamnogalacturonase B [Aspergillus nomiae NRRL 13137]|uniref:Rhamnogalacturonase B n=1 Tax=Aspergillus nomiae NRRL (strain ATCC 15546 / NRRL 13137 / CBS 260.88 / M93) TaxID=1509407 RepID=A0A0L1ITZ5_ASPN3|nr:rhamnogalacturonase B [Aspergillus nomiae NRRL 13137]KNG82934.1 rhamnogalacturonase B [Aspergillus nomiae NRRL 13137]
MRSASFLLWGLVPLLSSAQLTGRVGPLRSAAEKAAYKTCNVLDYGAVADLSTDISEPLLDAFADCNGGGLVYVPEGEYALSSWVLFDKGNSWALQLDGVIYRNGTDGGNMIAFDHTSDFEMFSSTGKGAIQGLRYEFRIAGQSTNTRTLRLQKTSSFAVHDIILVDSPAFHLSLDTVTDGEVYNVVVRGGNSGGLDGIDVWGENVWVHDVEVTNKDECVTVKNPSHNLLIENIYCNWSGGCAIGSITSGTNITDIIYRNVYTHSSNQMFMIKSNGGDGYVRNLALENFIGHGNAYSLDIDSAWSNIETADGDGVEFSNITISNWKGTEANGAQRGPIKILCPDDNPCYDITIKDFAMWTETGDSQTYFCQSAYGNGFCLQDGDDLKEYTTTLTTTSAPTGYAAPTMKEDLSDGMALNTSIAIPTIPASFYTGVTPYSRIAGGSSAAVTPSSSLASPSSFATASSTPVTWSSSVRVSSSPRPVSSLFFAKESPSSSWTRTTGTPTTTVATDAPSTNPVEKKPSADTKVVVGKCGFAPAPNQKPHHHVHHNSPHHH